METELEVERVDVYHMLQELSVPTLNCGYCSDPFNEGTVLVYRRGDCYSGGNWDSLRCVGDSCYYISEWGNLFLELDKPCFGFDELKQNDFTKWVVEEVEKRSLKLSDMRFTGVDSEIGAKARDIALNSLLTEYREFKINKGDLLHTILNYPPETHYQPEGIPFHISCIDDEVKIDREIMKELVIEGKSHSFQTTANRYVEFLLNHRPDLKPLVADSKESVRSYLEKIRFEETPVDLSLKYWNYGAERNRRNEAARS